MLSWLCRQLFELTNHQHQPADGFDRWSFSAWDFMVERSRFRTFSQLLWCKKRFVLSWERELFKSIQTHWKLHQIQLIYTQPDCCEGKWWADEECSPSKQMCREKFPIFFTNISSWKLIFFLLFSSFHEQQEAARGNSTWWLQLLCCWNWREKIVCVRSLPCNHHHQVHQVIIKMFTKQL